MNKSVERAAPGSVLGPLLFILYTSDLSDTVQSSTGFFADDTKVYRNPCSSDQLIQSDLRSIKRGSSDWLITLNRDKCTVLHISSTNPRLI